MRYHKRYLQARSSPWKKTGLWGRGQSAHVYVEQFLFFKKKVFFVSFEGDYTIIFSKQVEKENFVKVELKNFSVPHFSNPNFKPTFSLRFNARDVSQ